MIFIWESARLMETSPRCLPQPVMDFWKIHFGWTKNRGVFYHPKSSHEKIGFWSSIIFTIRFGGVIHPPIFGNIQNKPPRGNSHKKKFGHVFFGPRSHLVIPMEPSPIGLASLRLRLLGQNGGTRGMGAPLVNQPHIHHKNSGWTNPFEKYTRQNWIISLGRGWTSWKYLSCHHLAGIVTSPVDYSK